jgi:cell division protein FtsB
VFVFAAIAIPLFLLYASRAEEAREALLVELERFKALTKLAGLEQERAAQHAKTSRIVEEEQKLEKEITALKRHLVETHEEPLPATASPAEISKAFHDLGY